MSDGNEGEVDPPQISASAPAKVEVPEPPDYKTLLIDSGLYATVPLDEDRDEDWLHDLRYGTFQFDAHCIWCKQSVTFRAARGRLPADVTNAKNVLLVSPNSNTLRGLVFEHGHFSVNLACQRMGHMYAFYFFTTGKMIRKTGQHPSMEDVAGADIDRYRKILGSDFSEMRKAGGLFSHGIGIGAFVYLRRIFERLIEQARASANVDSVEFNKLRMTEKVEALKSVLPPSVVKFKGAYGILSKGIHELTEEECKTYFPVIRAAIIMMLEERYEAEQKAVAASDLARAFSAIQSGVSP